MNTQFPDPKAVFGYGSLVNRQTHAYVVTHKAQLHGWRRVWKQAASRPVSFLSIEPSDSTLQGLVARVGDTDWAALDEREHAYLRRDVNHQISHTAGPLDVVAYEANPDHTAPVRSNHPILLSYLDVVVAGYHVLMGDDGPRHFFDTTAGWGPIADDRAAPLYPRAQPLLADIREAVDAALAVLSVPVHPAEGALVDALGRGTPTGPARHNP